MREYPFAASEPHRLVENRVSIAGPHAELSIYDTYLPATNVELLSGELLYCGMIHGRKVMHFHDDDAHSTPFLPHESYVMAPGTRVEIDFPEARLGEPTRCLTVEISRDRIKQIAHQLLQQKSLPESIEQWHLDQHQFLHTPHTEGTQLLLQRLFQSFTHQDTDRDLAIDFGISELITRLLRHQGRTFLLNNMREDPELNGLNAALHWIEKHLSETLSIDDLCRLACMSRSKFYTVFKRQLGCTPAELQQKLRLTKAAQELREGHSITDVCFSLGYSSLSHFNRRFHQQFGCSPRQYLQRN